MLITSIIKKGGSKMKLFAKALTLVGTFIAATSTMGCLILILDEPEMPESLL